MNAPKSTFGFWVSAGDVIPMTARPVSTSERRATERCIKELLLRTRHSGGGTESCCPMHVTILRRARQFGDQLCCAATAQGAWDHRGVLEALTDGPSTAARPTSALRRPTRSRHASFSQEL